MKKRLIIFMAICLIILAFGISTELVAYLLNYDSLLGPRHLKDFYEPFHIVYWYLTLDVKGNQFNIAFTVLLILILFITVISFVLYFKIGKRRMMNLHGSSHWKTNKAFKKEGVLYTARSLMLTGIILGMLNTAKYKRKFKSGKEIWMMRRSAPLILDNQPEHILICAPTRGGKGIHFVIPNLVGRWFDSLFCYDPKKENYNLTAGFRSQFSRIIRFEPAAKYSFRWNPLFEIRKGDNEVADAQTIATILCDPDGKGITGDFWSTSARDLITGVILHLLYAEKEKSLPGIYNFLCNPERKIEESLKRMLYTKHLGDKVHPTVARIARDALDTFEKSENTFGGIKKSVTSFLGLFEDPKIANNVSSSDFYLEDLMYADDPVSLYFVVQGEDIDRMIPLTRLFINLCAKKLTAKLPAEYKKLNNIEKHHKLLFLIDEFPTLKKMPFFQEGLAFFAGYDIRCALITQSFNQLADIYGIHNSIKDNCRYLLYLGTDDNNDAKKVSELLGTATVEVKNQSFSGKKSAFMKSNLPESTTEAARPLMTPDEVLHLSYDEFLLIKGREYPYKGKKIMFFGDPRFSSHINLPTPEESGTERNETHSKRQTPWQSMPLLEPEMKNDKIKKNDSGETKERSDELKEQLDEMNPNQIEILEKLREKNDETLETLDMSEIARIN